MRWCSFAHHPKRVHRYIRHECTRCDNSDFHSTQIVSDSDTIGGTPCIDGHRIGVCHVIGAAREAIIAATKINYPQLTEDEVNAVVDYAFKVTAKHELVSARPTTVTPVGTCNRIDEERHKGLHFKIYDTNQSGPPFPCLNFVVASVLPVEAPSPDKWPDIPPHVVEPIVFRDKNLGICLLTRHRADQWVYRIHNGQWCSLRKVNAADPLFVTPLNAGASVVEAPTPDKELVAEMMHKLIQGPEELEECCKWLIQAARAAASTPPTTPEYPKPCGICDGVIQSKDDLDWHGYGNCRDIPDIVMADLNIAELLRDLQGHVAGELGERLDKAVSDLAAPTPPQTTRR